MPKNSLNFSPSINGSVGILSFSTSFKSKNAELMKSLAKKKAKTHESNFSSEQAIDDPHANPTTAFFIP
jgi:hypothetical protein